MSEHLDCQKIERRVWRTNKGGAIERLQLVSELMPDLERESVRIKVKSVG